MRRIYTELSECSIKHTHSTSTNDLTRRQHLTRPVRGRRADIAHVSLVSTLLRYLLACIGDDCGSRYGVLTKQARHKHRQGADDRGTACSARAWRPRRWYVNDHRLLKSSDSADYILPRTQTKFGEWHGFCYSSPATWNSLPFDLSILYLYIQQDPNVTNSRVTVEKSTSLIGAAYQWLL